MSDRKPVEGGRKGGIENDSEFINMESESVQTFLDNLDLNKDSEKELRKVIKKGTEISPYIWKANFPEFFNKKKN